MRKVMRLKERMGRDEKGSTGVLFALMLVPMMGLMALAVDYARALKVHDRMQTALDGAVLAAMRQENLSDAARQQVALAYFQANFKNEIAVKNQVVPTFTTKSDGSMVATARAEIRTPLGGVVLDPTMVVSTETKVQQANNTGQKLEVGMMIDVTGSMGATRNGMTKIAGLKFAARDLLSILYPNGDNPNVRVAVAPMADYVNAGEFASEATGLPDTGSYALGTNLTQTKQGPFSGSYSGVYGSNQPVGSQFGATSASSATAGATATSTHCTGGNEYEKYNNNYVGRKAGDNEPGRYWNQGAWWKKKWDDNRWKYEVETNDWIIRNRVSSCSEAADQSGKLVTCVTERTNTTTRYTDAAPSSGNYVGPYNQSSSGTTNKLNYSADGKCYVGGRELPAIIPLTSSKTTLSNFFENATVGGSTPGHLGHAWAWYMISPNWSSIWPAPSQPAAYEDIGTKKVAIIMTDGEYNTQYSSVASRTQALELCTKMKEKGVTVYTIGFGFSNSSTAGDGTAEGNTKQMLAQCSSGTNHFYFPYDSAALRQVFQNIGNGLMGSAPTTELRLEE